jgi:decaprenylphospho-beta-D-erythro-pentofuranosid-2-ulose 2-reductase
MTITMRSSTPHSIRMQRIVVLGATSAIAFEFQRQLARQRRELLLVARSPQRLRALPSDLLARGAKNVLTVAADLARVQHHAEIFDFVRRSFPKFDTVLLAYGTREDQKESEDSIESLLDELNVNFVSAAALLT